MAFTEYSNPNFRQAGSSPTTRDIAARSNAENRFAWANAARDCAKALGMKWPLEDPAEQDAVIAKYNRAVESGRGIVDAQAMARCEATMARLRAAGWGTPQDDGPTAA